VAYLRSLLAWFGLVENVRKYMAPADAVVILGMQFVFSCGFAGVSVPFAHSTEPASPSPCTRSPHSRRVASVGVACHVWPPYHPPSRTPCPGPWLCREPPFVWGRRPPCAWLAWGVCTVRQQRPHVLQGPWGRVTGGGSGLCGWGGGVPLPPSFPDPRPPCHGLCTP
jgi:hypothetical protein